MRICSRVLLVIIMNGCNQVQLNVKFNHYSNFQKNINDKDIPGETKGSYELVAIEPCSCQTRTGKKCIIHAEGNVEKSEL